jgi:phosphoribosyl 1,2-cyclic phosphodiesterase
MPKNFLRFWGVRGSCPAPFDTHLRIGGNTSCVEVRVGNQIVVCDAGTGAIPLGAELMRQETIRELTILLTHYHWDHISGLPFFLPAFIPGWTINFFGPGENTVAVADYLSNQMKAPYFPVETEKWLATVKFLPPGHHPILQGSIGVDCFSVHHPGITYGYRLDACGKRIVYVSDNELAFMDRSIDERKAEFNAHERGLLEEMRREEKDRVTEFMSLADVLIHDAQYTPEDYARKRGWGHSCYIDTVNSAIDAEVRNLYLFHYDPTHDDAAVDAMYGRCLDIIRSRNSQMACHLAVEGLTIDLDA